MIYIHVPFCKSFCTYCDFYSEICRDASSQQVQTFLESLRAETSQRREELSFHLKGSSTRTLYIGGGTPSVLPPASIRELLSMLPAPEGGLYFDEFTLEVNPDDITPAFALRLRSLGVNRISIGVQSLDDGILRWMNRRHTAGGAFRAFSILRETGFDNISVDLIFGISHLTDETLRATALEVLSWHPEHVSAYQLSVEEGSALHGMVLDGRYAEAPQEQCSRQYDLLCSLLREAGYRHYEISNWALPGREAVHNSAYWDRTPYAGLGPGAHSLSLSARERSWNSQEPAFWKTESETLSDSEVVEESIMLGLRRDIGLEEAFLRANVPSRSLENLLSDGSLEYLAYGPARRIRIPESRWFVSDGIIASLL